MFAGVFAIPLVTRRFEKRPGSNPTLSATQSGLQRNAGAFNSKLWEIAAILRFLP